MRLFKSIVCGILLVVFCFALVTGLTYGITLFPGITLVSLLLVLLVSVVSSIFYKEVFNEDSRND